MTSGAELLPIVTGAVATEGAKALRETISASLAEVWQGIVGDKIAAWRLSNAAAISKTLENKLKAQGLKIDKEKISDRYAYTWFEEASKQDEPEIQELFAQLLFNAAQGDENALDRRHLATLSQFTPIDAVVFNRLFYPKDQQTRVVGFATQLPRWPHEFKVRSLASELGQDAPNSIEHLINLGILARGFKIEAGASRRSLTSSAPVASLKVENEIIATGLGWSLHLALK